MGRKAAVPAADRALARVEHVPHERFPDQPCWEWRGYCNDGGYGVVGTADGSSALTHRVVYEALVGPIPPRHVLDHTCRNRACCNPAHLEPVVQRVNYLRGAHPHAEAHRTGICKRGHDTTLVGRTSTGDCRECRKVRRQEAATRKRGQA